MSSYTYKEHTNKHCNVEREKLSGPQHYPKTYRQLENVESEISGLRQERACQLGSLYQMSSPKKYIHTSNTEQTEQVVFMDMCILSRYILHMGMCACIDTYVHIHV